MALTLNPFDLDASAIKRLLDPAAPLLPELEAARANIAALRDAPQTSVVLAQTEPLMGQISQIPQTPYTLYRLFLRDGDRGRYEAAYFGKRRMLAAAALRLFLDTHNSPIAAPDAHPAVGVGGSVAARASLSSRKPPETPYSLKDVVQDYLWNICEESSWVLPAHEQGGSIDLFAAETAFVLAEALLLLGDTLDGEVRRRVRVEVDRRVLEPYLRFGRSLFWHQVGMNWNGVCNSAVAASFLLLEPEPGRVAQALEIAFGGLRTFLAKAFEADGSSTEGVAYWHYGLINFVALAEMLRARSHGAIDLLAGEHLRSVAAYPARMQLSGSSFASFSDCDEQLRFNPGIVARMAERTGERSLLNLLARPAQIEGDWRLTMMLRNMLWWDGQQPEDAQIDDAHLPSAGVARLVARTDSGAQVVLALKAGHNAENHNQNDVGSFVLHVGGENMLVDPGRGLYSRAYFGPQRYQNIFANSYGHSVPRIDGQLQSQGAAFRGELLAVETDGPVKRAQVELARAYDVAGLAGARRELRLGADGTAWLCDEFRFDGRAGLVEEALLTWHDVDLDGATALIHGQRHDLRLTIEQPAGAAFALELLEQQCIENAKPGVLRRLTMAPPAAERHEVRVRMSVLEQ